MVKESRLTFRHLLMVQAVVQALVVVVGMALLVVMAVVEEMEAVVAMVL